MIAGATAPETTIAGEFEPVSSNATCVAVFERRQRVVIEPIG
jgi:hypothetical protein